MRSTWMPCASWLTGLIAAVTRASEPTLGLATDGDADRFAVVAPGGRLLNESESLALIVDHLGREGRARRGLAVGMATGSLVSCIAERHGLDVYRRPIGFKYLADDLCSGRADVAGDESGGFALAESGHDKDGLLACCLIVEMLAADLGGIEQRLGSFESDFGKRTCSRRALSVTSEQFEAFARLLSSPPDRVGGLPVREARTDDGLWLGFADGFLMIRQSGTEPVMRIYAEAPGEKALEDRLAKAAGLLGPPSPS